MFSSFEDLIDYAHLQTPDIQSSELYEYEHRYYLALKYKQAVKDENGLKNSLALAYEYGNPTATTVVYLTEHAKKLMPDSALTTVRHYFK